MYFTNIATVLHRVIARDVLHPWACPFVLAISDMLDYIICPQLRSAGRTRGRRSKMIAFSWNELLIFFFTVVRRRRRELRMVSKAGWQVKQYSSNRSSFHISFCGSLSLNDDCKHATAKVVRLARVLDCKVLPPSARTDMPEIHSQQAVVSSHGRGQSWHPLGILKYLSAHVQNCSFKTCTVS